MKNRIYNTLVMFVLGLVIVQAQSISGEFDVLAIGAEGTATLTITANPPNVDQQPGDFQVLIDFPNDGSYIDMNGGDPTAGSGAPNMTWIQLADGGGSDSWLGTNDNVVAATIGGGQWTVTVEGIGPDSGGNQVFSVVSLVYNDGVVEGNIIDNPAGLILDDLLPVEFSYIDARNQDCESVNVVWQTQSEINNEGFFIERSVGAANDFKSLGFVEGIGNSTIEQDYSFVDDIKGFNANANFYYRIKQVDLDGRFSYSKTVVINLECEGKIARISVYPNPTINDLYVNVEGDLDVATSIIVLNNLSQIVGNLPVNKNDTRTKVDMSNYIAGMYFIRVLNNTGEIIFTEKIILTK